MLAFLFASSDTAQPVNEAIDLLKDALPEVPYYLQHFSKLPAVEIYNKFMLCDGEAIPLEFVFFPPDKYINEIVPALKEK